jgi:selenocysteine lyase/cysteine desulfurase
LDEKTGLVNNWLTLVFHPRKYPQIFGIGVFNGSQSSRQRISAEFEFGGRASTCHYYQDSPDPQEVGKFLDQEGIAVRAGHHCAQPTMRRYGVTGTVRPSLAFYNTCEEIDSLVAAILKYKKIN